MSPISLCISYIQLFGIFDKFRLWQVIAYLQLYFHFFQLKKLSYLRKIDVHIFIFKIKVNTEMGSRKKGKL